KDDRGGLRDAGVEWYLRPRGTRRRCGALRDAGRGATQREMAPVAATITILDLFIGIAPSLGDLGASSAVGEECGSKLNIRCETREGERRTKGHPGAPSARTVRLADGRARRAEPGRVVHGRAGGGTGPSRALGE